MNSNMDTLILNSHCATKIDMENRQSYVIITGGENTATHLLIFNTTSEFKRTDGKFAGNPRVDSSWKPALGLSVSTKILSFHVFLVWGST